MNETYIYNPTAEERKAVFVASCIESVSNMEKRSSADVYQLMSRLGMIDGYILPCYDVLHTESRENLTQDLIHTMHIWSQKKGIAL